MPTYLAESVHMERTDHLGFWSKRDFDQKNITNFSVIFPEYCKHRSILWGYVLRSASLFGTTLRVLLFEKYGMPRISGRVQSEKLTQFLFVALRSTGSH